MGRPVMRLNPQLESMRNRVLLTAGTDLLLSVAMILPPPRERRGRGRRPVYDYRIVLVLCILRTLLRKRYADYESEMRTDKRLIDMLGMDALPCKSTVNNYALQLRMSLLYRLNKLLIAAWVKKPIDLLFDASGIRIIGRSVWYCIRTKQRVLKRDCDKVHLAISHREMLIVNWRMTNGHRNDSPFLRVLLAPFKVLGFVLVDKGYINKINAEFVAKKQGAFFSPFKKNARPSGLNTWAYLDRLWHAFSEACEAIYHQRSRVEAVFSALKKRYGDQLYSKKWHSRRREMALRFLAYNLRIIIALRIAREQGMPLWVRA